MHISFWAHSVPGPGDLTSSLASAAPQEPAGAGFGADPVGSSEWAQSPVYPQSVLRAALGAAPEGSAGGAGHHRAPCAHQSPGLGPELLPTLDPRFPWGQKTLLPYLCSFEH